MSGRGGRPSCSMRRKGRQLGVVQEEERQLLYASIKEMHLVFFSKVAYKMGLEAPLLASSIADASRRQLAAQSLVRSKVESNLTTLFSQLPLSKHT